MGEVIQGRSMPDAKYLKDGKYYDIKAVDVDPKEKDHMSFYCMKCKIKVIYVQGKTAEGSKPFFRKAPGVPHVEGCYYGKKKTIQEVIREVGTADGLLYGVKPPLSVQRQSEIGDEVAVHPKEKKPPKERNPIEQRVNKDKKHQKHLFTVDDLFHEITDIKTQEPALRSKLFNKLMGKIYYPYSEYSLIKENHQKGKLRTYFFTAGKINVFDQDEYYSIEKGYIILHGKGNDNIKLRLFPFEEKISVQLKKLRYKTKSVEKKKWEFIGAKVQFRQIIEEDDITYIDLDLYEYDLNQYMYN
ncbi:hypothetical protein [Bacillus atrophaeus]|uniref:hypothetical protein n=1 Tax=Bacillus atrophaeus TaxID=1452 RepID=UPI002E2178B7|nr:hypothetical protein [Bacillus atrophaeus]MED1032515.1 hypothetical protein [Bacillus atrophaeus]MED1121039.1 hypothetical protein [Bacillus atrophaeus]